MITLEHLSKRFGQHVVLDDVALTVEKGDVVALIGSSGAGKSTFLRALNYLEQADQGTLQMNDFTVDFAHISKKEILALRRQTAMVFQQFHLFQQRTALENVMEGLVIVKNYPKAKAEQTARALLEKVGLSDRVDFYPKQLSGGQQQRVAIARALAMEPELLLLDEPTSALDPELVGEVLQTIQATAKSGQTMILVSHEMDFVREVATKVLFLEKGKIVEAGTPEQIFTRAQSPRTQEFLQRFYQSRQGK